MEKIVTFHNLISLVLNLQFRIPQDLWFLANNSTSTMRLTEEKGRHWWHQDSRNAMIFECYYMHCLSKTSIFCNFCPKSNCIFITKKIIWRKPPLSQQKGSFSHLLKETSSRNSGNPFSSAPCLFFCFSLHCTGSLLWQCSGTFQQMTLQNTLPQFSHWSWAQLKRVELQLQRLDCTLLNTHA